MQRVSGVMKRPGGMLLQEFQRMAVQMAVIHPWTRSKCMMFGDYFRANLLKSRKVHDQYRLKLFEPSRDAHLGSGL